MQGAELAALAVGVWIAMPWRPGRVDQREPIVQLVRFSSFYSLSTLVNYLGQNLEKIILPVLLGGMADRAIGLYSQAFSLAIKPVYLITSPLVGVMVSALARMRQDGAAYTDLVTRFFRLAAIGLFPCAAGLTAVAPDLILVLAGPDWAEAGPLLSAMAPAVFAIGLINLAGVLLASVGRAGQLLFASVLYCVLLAQGFFAGYYAGGRLWPGDASGESWYGGVIGAAVAFTVVTVGVWLPPFLWFCFRTAGVRTAVVLRALGSAMRAALLMGMVVWGLRRVLLTMEGVPAWLRLVVLVASGVLLYFILARGEIRWFLDEWIHLSDRKPAQPTKRG
jgi:PST family polysaccharide transporter